MKRGVGETLAILASGAALAGGGAAVSEAEAHSPRSAGRAEAQRSHNEAERLLMRLGRRVIQQYRRAIRSGEGHRTYMYDFDAIGEPRVKQIQVVFDSGSSSVAGSSGQRVLVADVRGGGRLSSRNVEHVSVIEGDQPDISDQRPPLTELQFGLEAGNDYYFDGFYQTPTGKKSVAGTTAWRRYHLTSRELTAIGRQMDSAIDAAIAGRPVDYRLSPISGHGSPEGIY